MEFEVFDYEMIHYADDNLFIAHKSNIITYVKNDNVQKIKMPEQIKGFKKFLMQFRKARRALRLDKAIIQPIDNGFVMIRFNDIWIYKNSKWIKSEQKLNCRNPMYNGFLRMDDGILYIAEYGNPGEVGKRIFKSIDNGFTWECVHQFKRDEIRHIHCLMWDSYEEKIWIGTGDFDKEPKVLKTDKNFDNVELVGGGSQEWRTCHFIFSESKVEWFMDSPLEDVYHIFFDRKNGDIKKQNSIAGPVWFARKYNNDVILAVSVQEKGPSHKDKLMHLYKIENGKLEDIFQFEHDGWPKGYFRFGTICFSRGEMKDNSFYIFCEGVKGLDGKSALCRITD